MAIDGALRLGEPGRLGLATAPAAERRVRSALSDAVVDADVIVACGSVFADDGMSRAAIVVASRPTEN